MQTHRFCLQGSAMTRYGRVVILGLILAWGCIACAPKVAGPTPNNGYFVSLRIPEPIIYPRRGGASSSRQITRKSELIVLVKDAQGQPVDGVPVEFELAPDWAQDASITPPRADTRGGAVHAILESDDIGLVYFNVRVDGLPQKAFVTVQNRATGTGTSGGGGGS